MAFGIVRNDITKMNTEAIVNTANAHVSFLLQEKPAACERERDQIGCVSADIYRWVWLSQGGGNAHCRR